ncbi:MAG: Bax inhibitor-1/YccA family protein [bacterium]
MQNEYVNSVPNQKYEAIEKAQTKFMSKVYSWMLAGLLVTAAATYFTTTSGLLRIVYTNSILLILLLISEFGLVIYLSARIQTMKVGTAIGSFLLYAGLTGVTLSCILARYSTDALVSAFGISAGMFASLSLYGFVTKKNLSGWGSFLFMGLVGILLIGVVNFFVQSNAMWFVFNIAGVIIFAGLTAYDTQKIKEMFYMQAQGAEIATKGAIMGALRLYLDFINLFLMILRLVGGGSRN